MSAMLCQIAVKVRKIYILTCHSGNVLFLSMKFFKNSHFVPDEFLWILENSQHVHEQFFRFLVKLFRILYSFLRISDVIPMNCRMNSWRGGSRTRYEFSEFLRTLKNKLCVHKNSS